MYSLSSERMLLSRKVSKISKRDGGIDDFEQEKITAAISKAMAAVNHEDGKPAQKLSNEVVKLIDERFEGRIPSVENVQDIVEEVLIRGGYAEVAKAYILYRQRRTEIREFKKFFDVVDDLKPATRDDSDLGLIRKGRAPLAPTWFFSFAIGFINMIA